MKFWNLKLGQNPSMEWFCFQGRGPVPSEVLLGQNQDCQASSVWTSAGSDIEADLRPDDPVPSELIKLNGHLEVHTEVQFLKTLLDFQNLDHQTRVQLRSTGLHQNLNWT